MCVLALTFSVAANVLEMQGRVNLGANQSAYDITDGPCALLIDGGIKVINSSSTAAAAEAKAAIVTVARTSTEISWDFTTCAWIRFGKRT